VPPISILAEPSVAVVTKNTERKGTTKAATAYLEFLYTPEAQQIIAKNYYRPTDPTVIEATKANFPTLTLFPVTDVAASWGAASDRFFAEGTVFDQLYGAGGAPSAPK
jgi:sulfate transport system substrate-binding protein